MLRIIGILKSQPQAPRDGWFYLILLLALGLRTYHIAYPPWDYHNWRQTNTLMVARDFARRGFDLLHPQVAWISGNQPERPSYFSGEFSIESILAAGLYRAFGESHYAARVVVIAFSLAGIYFLYSLLDRRAGRRAARCGAFLLTINPYWLFFGRVFMPDVPALALALGGLNTLDRWLDERRKSLLFLGATLTALALLQKLTVVVVALPAALLFWNALGWRLVRRWEAYGFAAVAGLPALLWYTHAASLACASGFSIMPVGSFGWNVGRWLDLPLLEEAASRLARETFSPLGLVLVVAGLLWLARGRLSWILRMWLAAGLAFLGAIPDVLGAKYYYLLLFVLPGCGLGGLALARLMEISKLKRFVYALLVFLAADALRCARPLYHEDREPYDLGMLVNRLSDPSDLVIAEGGGSPTMLYAADRQGWMDAENDPARLGQLAGLGARYYARIAPRDHQARQQLFEALDKRFYRLTPEHSPWVIYSLAEPQGILREIPEGGIQSPYPVNFNRQIQMLGTSQRELLSWPASFEVTYYWQCLKKLDRHLRIFVHITTPEGQMVYQQDHWLLAEQFQTPLWNVGEVIRERYALILPAHLPPGRYQLRVGWFDPGKGGRLPIVSPGASDGEERARVAEIAVRRPPRYRWFWVDY